MSDLQLRPTRAPIPSFPQREDVPRAIFDDFLARARAHERMGGVVSPFLFKTALWADAFLLAAMLFVLALSPSGVGRSGFFLIGGGIASALISFLHALAWLLIPLAVIGLAVKLWARDRRTHESVHYLCAAESLAAIGTGLTSSLLLLVFAIELLIWMVIIVACAALVIAVIGGLIAGAGS